MSQNPDAVANQGEFAGHVKPSEPLLSGGVSRFVFEPVGGINRVLSFVFSCMFGHSTNAMTAQTRKHLGTN